MEMSWISKRLRASLLNRRYHFLAVFVVCVIISFYTFNARLLPSRDNRNHWDKPYVAPQDDRLRWRDLPQRYPVSSLSPLPSGVSHKLPTVQHSFLRFLPESKAATSTRASRRSAVKSTFDRCWKAYKEHAWLHDELAPVSGGSKDTFGGWAATLVDSLDSLWIMDMKTDFEEAVTALSTLDFGPKAAHNGEINVFETTIRYLGGFLSAYDLSHDLRLLHKAVEVGEMLYAAFDTPNRMPITRWEPRKAAAGAAQEAPGGVLVAEIGSLSLEFTRLSQLTRDPQWYDAIARVTKVFDEQQNKTKLPGMWPVVVNAKDQDFTQDTTYTLGAMSDSLYEYFPKMYALLGGLSPEYQKLYQDSMATAIEHNLFRPMTPSNEDILLSGQVHKDVNTPPELEPQGQHLVCFAGGMLALGGRLFQKPAHVHLAQKLVDGCVWTYRACPLGIMPETFHMIPCPSRAGCAWNESRWHSETLKRGGNDAVGMSATDYIARRRLPPGFTAIGDYRYILRPEAIESVFLLYRMTGRQDLQDTAWEMFQNIERYTKTEFGNAALSDMTIKDNPPKSDSMESFWMAETLKYLYLIFSEPDLISLDDYVFNTEAHPFRRPRGRL